MTFLDPQSSTRTAAGVKSHLARFGRVASAADRRRTGDEDGARRAFGNDPMIPPTLLGGASLEHLARIALG